MLIFEIDWSNIIDRVSNLIVIVEVESEAQSAGVKQMLSVAIATIRQKSPHDHPYRLILVAQPSQIHALSGFSVFERVGFDFDKHGKG